MFLLLLLVLPPSCISDQECGQISAALEKDLGNELGSAMAESDDDGGGNRIINGKDAPTNSFPWHAQLALVDETKRTANGPESSGMCGGAIIAPLHVLTAAHCLEGPGRKVAEVC